MFKLFVLLLSIGSLPAEACSLFTFRYEVSCVYKDERGKEFAGCGVSDTSLEAAQANACGSAQVYCATWAKYRWSGQKKTCAFSRYKLTP